MSGSKSMHKLSLFSGVGQDRIYTVCKLYFWRGIHQIYRHIRCIYTVYVLYFWRRNHQIYGHIRCIYTALANPTLS